MNTMGSKADGLRVSELIIAAKAELEKMREQVQNVEWTGAGRARRRGRDRPARRGLLFIVSAPSGAGKTTLVERLVEQTPHLRMSRSYTSRPARAGRDRRRGL